MRNRWCVFGLVSLHQRPSLGILLQLPAQADLIYIYKELPVGRKAKLRYEFEKTGQEKYGAGGICRLYINDEKVGEGQIPHTSKFCYSFDEGFDIGRDSGSPVSEEYKARTNLLEEILRE